MDTPSPGSAADDGDVVGAGVVVVVVGRAAYQSTALSAVAFRVDWLRER